MQPHPTPLVLEVDDVGAVVALVEAGESADEVLCRAVDEVASRAGDLVVIQLVDDPSILRRALAKAVLARDVAWWSRDVAGIEASIMVVDDDVVADAAALTQSAACIVMSRQTSRTAQGMAVLGRRSSELSST